MVAEMSWAYIRNGETNMLELEANVLAAANQALYLANEHIHRFQACWWHSHKMMSRKIGIVFTENKDFYWKSIKKKKKRKKTTEKSKYVNFCHVFILLKYFHLNI